MRSAILVPFLFAATACTALPGDDTTTPAGKICTLGRVVAGNPLSTAAPDPALWNPSGHGAKAEPPMSMFNIAGHGKSLIVNAETSLWRIDLAAASPTFVRVLGDSTASPIRYQPSGSCSAGRLMFGDGLAWLGDGRLLTGDDWANGVVELSDPVAGNCTVKSVAGNAAAIDRSALTPDNQYMPGDVIGAGALSRFASPDDATADADGNVYVWDRNNHKVKRIANDAARTVTTVFTLGDQLGNINSMVVRDGKLFAGGNGSDGTRILEIDLASGSTRTYLHEDQIVDAVGGNLPIAMIAEGADLLVYMYGGRIYRVAADGTATRIAGFGPFNSSLEPSQYAGDLDALAVPLAFPSMVSRASMYWDQGHLYVPSYQDNWALWDFTCN